MGALVRLRQECIEAKEALSSETDATIPVLLPNVQSEVRLTRVEFEAMIRPSLTETIGALRRAVQSAGVEPAEVKAVLLVGGSSRIPLVGQLVSAELGRPVAVDAHPKHAIALGAAIAAASTRAEDAVVVASEEADAPASAGDDGYWFYVEQPQWLVSPYDHAQTVGVLDPGRWYIAGEEHGGWVYTADAFGREGWVPRAALRRYES
jgi:hypothetical protein